MYKDFKIGDIDGMFVVVDIKDGEISFGLSDETLKEIERLKLEKK